MGGRDNVEKNQAKRTHARCGDKRKVRESGEREGRERGPRKNSKRESGGGGIMEKNQAKRIHSRGGDGQKVREGGSKHMREGKRDESEKNKLKRTRERNLPAYNTQAH